MLPSFPLRPSVGVPVLALSAFALWPMPTDAPSRRVDGESRPALAEPSLSPDRKEIAFSSGGDLWVVPAAGGTATLLVSHPAHESRPLWSPDGTRIAFTSTRTGNGDVYVLTLATNELRRITFDDGGDQLDAWSRDGRWLYFSSTSRDIAGMNDVWRVAAAGGTPQQVAADRYANEYWAQPSPSDPGTLAISARGIVSGQWWRRGHSHIDESELWVVRDVAPGAGGAPRYEAVTNGGTKDMWPMWSADGRSLLFVRDSAGVQNLYSTPVAASGGVRTATRLTSFRDGRVLWPSMSYDGRTVVFERDFRVWSYDVASREVREVPVTLRGASAQTGPEHLSVSQGFQELALSPDGKKVAYVARGEVFAASAKDGGDGERLTRTPGATEGQLAWLPDSRRLLYMSDRDGTWRLWMYDFATSKETQLSRGEASDAEPEVSPDGRSVAFVRGGRELRVLDVATRQERMLARGVFDRWPFLTVGAMAWSPDGRWLAYWDTGNRLLSNVFIVPAAGGEPRQVSFLPNTNGSSLQWSPDGTYLLLQSSQRTETAAVVRIDLQPRTPRFREDQFRDLFRDVNPRPNVPSPQPGTPSTPTPSRDTSAARPTRAADSAGAATPPARVATNIDFDGIRQRMSILPVGVDVGNAIVSPDGKTLLMVASAAGQQNLYTWSLDELARETPVARQLTSTAGFKTNVQWSSDSKEVWYLENGRISAMPIESRQARSLAVNAEMDVDFAAEKAEVFAGGWRVLDDWFYDEKHHGVDWKATRAAYAPVAAGTRTTDELRRVMNVMIGELNASHTGAGGPGFNPTTATGRLGLRFDRVASERDGRLVVTEIIPLSPAAIGKSIAVGDRITSVDGQALDARTNLDSLLAFRIGRRVALGVTRGGGTPREVALRPVNGGTEKNLLYRDWVESRRAYVEKVSGGRLGYVHMIDMGAGSLAQLQLDLDAANMAREGVVVDVRNNNGGFVNAYAIDIFARRGYMGMQPRGAPKGNARTLLGQRSLELPTALVTNQHSLSDAEDFTEGYRTLKLGPVVGEPTAGWIIYTGGVTLLDGTTVRVPFTRITDAEGKDMELAPRPVDVPVKRPIGEWYTGRDVQLDAAVKELLGRLGRVAGR